MAGQVPHSPYDSQVPESANNSTAGANNADADAAPTPMQATPRRDPTNQKRGRFFAVKQLLLFGFMAAVILFVDLFLYIGIMMFEMNANPDSNISAVSNIGELALALSQEDDGSWTLTNNEVINMLDEYDSWAILVDPNGAIAWSYNFPDDMPTTFTRSLIAVIATNHAYASYTTFMWTTDDDYLVIQGYPEYTFTHFSMTLPTSSMEHVPLYILLVFLVDLLIIFLLYAISQRSVVKSVGGTLDALDDLADGRVVNVNFAGSLKPVGQRINRVSNTLIRKETARKNWVAGVSHDVRTPLAVVMGHAERIEQDAELPQATRDSATTITRQGVRIRDLIEDLNIATQLEYDMQPLSVEPVNLPRMLRDVVADYLNQGLDEGAELELSVSDTAAEVVISGDERLLKRALRNAVDNALKHNGYACRVVISLEVEAGEAALSIADNGRGMTPEQLATLAETLEQDYLGTGSVTARGEDFITLSGGTALLPHQAKPGAPLPPPEIAGRAYAAGTTAPSIKSQRSEVNYTVPHVSASETPSTGTIGQHGLGLPLIARIAIVHHASITFASPENEGLTITLRFPQ